MSLENNLIFAALRLPPCIYLNDSSPSEGKSPMIDAFSSTFLSDNKNTSNEMIHIDYEHYSFAFQLSRWPKNILDCFINESQRIQTRQWPSQYHLNILIKTPLLLTPISTNHHWEMNYDLIEQNLFEWMNESTLCFYTLCQQLFTTSMNTRTCLKHCFLNYCEKYGLPFSK